MDKQSYWHHTAAQTVTISPPKPTTPARYHTAVGIIGAGIVGAAAAYLLAQDGIPAIVIDRHRPALGATGRNAGMIVASAAGRYYEDIDRFGRQRAYDLRQFSVKNREQLIALAERLHVPVSRIGSLILAHSPEERNSLAASAELLLADGFAAEYTPHDPLGRGFHAALGDPDNAAVHPASLVQAILRAAEQPILPYTDITRIEAHQNNWLLHSEQAIIECEQVFIATNAYAPQLNDFFADKIQPCRGQIQVTALGPRLLPQSGSSQFGYYYFRHVPDPIQPGRARWLIGGARNANFGTENGHYDQSPTADIQNALITFTAKHFPELANLPIEYRWAGTMGFTADHLPLVGELPDMPGVFYCVGFSGHGLGMGFRSTQAAVAYMRHGTDPYPLQTASS